jgi:hypothetical protein
MQETKISVKIKGVADLLMNKFTEEKNQNSRGKKVYDDKEETEKKLYRDEEGIFAPNTWIKECLVKSAKDFKIKGRKSYSDYFKSGILVLPQKIRGNLTQIGYETHKVPVVIQRARIMRCRPLFRNWELEFEIQIIDPQISHQLIKEVLEASGKYCGIGDWRGEYGRFEVIKFVVLKNE